MEKVPDTGKNWLLARVRPAHEFIAARHLRRAKRSFYLPTIWDRARKRTQVLFASYIFINADQDYGNLRVETWELCSLVKFGKSLAFVPDDFINYFKSLENINGNIELPGTEVVKPVERRLRKGDKVRLLYGPFANQVGKFESMSAQQRATVLLRVLNQLVPVTVNRRLLEHVSVDPLLQHV